MTIISEHTVDLSLLTRKSKVLDLGARNFGFTNGILEHVDHVCAVEPDPDISTSDVRIELLNAAVTAESGPVKYYRFGNGTGNYVGGLMPAIGEELLVEGYSIDDLCDYFGVEFWDLCKMDIEGSEYLILMNIERAFCNQLSIEFHAHLTKAHYRYYEPMIQNLLKYYYPVSHERTEAHGCGFNWWDSLFKAK